MHSSNNGKPHAPTNDQTKEQSLLARFDAFEQRLVEELRSPTGGPRSTLRNDQSGSQGLRLIDVMQHILQAATERTPIQLDLNRWPASFARILIDAGVRCDESCREAVRRYVEILQDLQRHEHALSESHGNQRRLLEDSVVRWRRQLDYHHGTLRNFGILAHDIEIGSPFDPQLHEPTGAKPTDDPSQVDRIASVQRPLFTWKDQNGTAQCVPAQVVIFELSKTTPTPDAGGDDVTG